MKKKHLLITAALLVGVALYSCKKELNPTKDSVTKTAAAGSTAYLKSIVLGTYTQLQGLTANNAMLLTSEETTDALIVPGRIGGDWADGGVWQQLWLHTYTAAHGNISGAWDNAYNTIGAINITIDLFKGLPQTSGTTYSIAELKTLRDYFYFLLLTNYGNVPLITSSSTDASTVKNSSATDVYNFLVGELKADAPVLSANSPAKDPSQYGRLNRWGAYFLLAKLYLNQNVITGSTDNSGYTACSSLCDSLMSSNAGYSLMPNFLDNFSSNNTGSTENIFVIPYDHINAQGLQIQMMSFHYNQAAKYNWGSTGGPWNGFCANADFYGKFSNTDSRKAGFQHGIQYAADGITPLTTRGSDSSLVLNFRPQVTSLYTATEYDGVRQQKWQLTPGYQSQDADFALFRYSDVLLMKAECVMRLGDPGGALQYTAAVRQRAGLANFSGALVADSLLAERGREFVWEGWRRQDLIRYGHFGDAKQFKTADADTHTQLFPIPTEAIQKNPNLKQNPGFN